MYAPPPVEDFGGWYLRGDIGFSNQNVNRPALWSRVDVFAADLVQSAVVGFDTAGIFGLGVGYRFNNWFRADVTGQYRGNSNFNGPIVITGTAGGVLDSGIDNYSASKSEWLVLANAYVDLGTWWCMTPFIGAGVGARAGHDRELHRSAVSPTVCHAAAVGLRVRATRLEVEFRLGRSCGSGLQCQSRICHVELAYQLCRSWATASTGVLTTFDGTTNNVTRDVQGHHLARPEARRALESRYPAGLCAAADHARADRASHLLMIANGAGSSRAVLFCVGTAATTIG